MLSVEERLRRKDELIKNGYKVERNASWGPNLNKMYMSMKAKTPKKKSWAQSVKNEGLISGTMDKIGITNPYAKVAAEFTPLIPGIGNYISVANAITDLGRGHFKDAAWNALYALPVAGNVMKGLGMGAKALKGLNAVGRVGGIAQWGDVIGQTAAPTIKTIRDAWNDPQTEEYYG